MDSLSRGDQGGIDTPLIKGGRGDRHPLIKAGLRGDRHPPYQGGQGGSAPPLLRGAGGIEPKIYLQFNYNQLLISNLLETTR